MADITKTIKLLLIGDAASASKALRGVSSDMQGVAKQGGKFKQVGANFRDAMKSGKGFKGSVKGAVSELGGVGGIAKTAGLAVAGVGVAAAAAGAAIAVKFGADSVDTFKRVAGEVAKLKRVTGLTTEDASRLAFSLKQSGVDGEKGAKSLQIFAKNLDKMAEQDGKAKDKAGALSDSLQSQIVALRKAGPSTKGYSDKMKELRLRLSDANLGARTNVSALGQMGIQYMDAHGKMLPMSQLLPKIAGKFSTMPDGTHKTALAMKLFGKSGTDLLPFLNKGAKGLEDLAKKSDAFGNTLSDKDLQALKDSKQAQRDWDAAMQGLQVTLGKYLLPVLTQFAVQINSVAVPAFQSIAGWINKNQDVFVALGDAMKWVWNNVLLPVVKFMLSGMAATAGSIGQVIQGIGRLTNNKGMQDFGERLSGMAYETKQWADSLQGIPDTVAPTIDVKAEEAKKKTAAIDADIKKLNRQRVKLKSEGDTAGVKKIDDAISALKKKKKNIYVDVQKSGLKSIKIVAKGSSSWSVQGSSATFGKARGGFAMPGWYQVGEHGPELVRFNRSGWVSTAPQSRAVMRQASTGATASGSVSGARVTMQFNVPPTANQAEIWRTVRDGLLSLKGRLGLRELGLA